MGARTTPTDFPSGHVSREAAFNDSYPGCAGFRSRFTETLCVDVTSAALILGIHGGGLLCALALAAWLEQHAAVHTDPVAAAAGCFDAPRHATQESGAPGPGLGCPAAPVAHEVMTR